MIGSTGSIIPDVKESRNGPWNADSVSEELAQTRGEDGAKSNVGGDLLDIDQLGALVRKRRKELGLNLRDVAVETDVSFNTLSRVERGHIPDLKTFRKLVAWLGVDPGRFFELARIRFESTPEVVADHLRNDPFLPNQAAERIAGIVEDLYRELVRHEQTLTVHLRAAATFKPEAAKQLASLLGDLQSALESE
jgi:transcriptional regulator with XRE-family HTH domain